jgi:hypothetical protein
MLQQALGPDGNHDPEGRAAARSLVDAGLDLAAALDTGACGEMVDQVVARARAARAAEAAQWPS